MKKLSIIIPLYNVEQFVERAAKSIVSQQFSYNDNNNDIEVVLVDDGSTDSSLDICLKNLQGVKGINTVPIRQENKGLSAARNAGIHAATGEYILFLDADDFLLPNALENIIKDLNTAQCDVLFGRYRLWNPKKGFRPLKPYNYNPPTDTASQNNITDYTLTDYILTKLPEPSWNVWRYICKRDFILSNNLYFEEGILCEDVPWTLNMLEKAKTIHFLQEPFYAYYHRRTGSIMNTKNTKRITDLNTIVIRFLQRLREDPERTALYKTLVNQSFVYIYEYCLFTKSDRKILFDSYKLIRPMFSHSISPIHRIAARFNRPILLYWLSVLMMCMVKVRRFLKRIA